MTQSDYVKGELLSLQQQLQALEERAKNIEADIRNVMSMGKPTDLDTCTDWVVFILSVLDFQRRYVSISDDNSDARRTLGLVSIT